MIFNCRIANNPSKSINPKSDSKNNIGSAYAEVREATRRLRAPLCPEDCVIQSMPDASPTRWHMAHTTWFFETFVLGRFAKNYKSFQPEFSYLFNSYYNTVGAQFARPNRGLLSRPTVAEIDAYRSHVDEKMCDLLASDVSDELRNIVEIGLHHEQQHQELIVTDIKNAFSLNPIHPVYRDQSSTPQSTPISMGWGDYAEGLFWIGHAGDGFGYDNEFPRHRVFLESFELAKRLVTNGEYMEFIADDGYKKPELWLSEGWQTSNKNNWEAPLYWFREHEKDKWHSYTLSGKRPVDPNEPACHVSYFEADAFARWSGCRLPLEAEWEIATADVEHVGNFVESELFHPAPAKECPGDRLPQQMYGDVWEWTSSQYSAYPGYQPPPGAMGEYNGKFMCNQFVLRGGSCATPASHIRHTYRNFFPPDARWQFSGIRLAR